MIQSPLNQLQEIPPKKRTLKGHLRRIEKVSLRHAHRFVVRRFANLREVRRHATGWVILVLLLSGASLWQANVASAEYTQRVPAEGRVFAEGVFGAIDNINPIFAATPAERAASRLIFSPLLAYDNNGETTGVLARDIRLDDSGKIVTVSLRQDARWHDGQPVTADDVVFTFSRIKNADTRSPLYSSWRNIGVAKANDTTVRFTLPVEYAAFESSLTVGILPEHILSDVRPSELRTESFNRAPVGSGPFTFQGLSAVDAQNMHYILRLAANQDYVLGAPKLNGFHLHAYKDREDLPRALRTQEVASISDPTINQLYTLDMDRYTVINAPLDNGVYAFFNMESDKLNDNRVRRALMMATNQASIVQLFNESVSPLDGPLLPGQLGYSNTTRQAHTNIERAKQLLDDAGWKRTGQGEQRSKDGQPLRLQMVSLSSGNYPMLVEELRSQWSKIGVEFDADSPLVRPDDIQQSSIVPRAYDVLVYEIAIGRDPDVYAYWHSSQATSRGFNLSNYKSAKVDEALDSARTRHDTALREAKYQLFTQEWLADVPAVALYRPSLVYVQNNDVVTFGDNPIAEPADRYFNVRYWAAGQQTMRPTR